MISASSGFCPGAVPSGSVMLGLAPAAVSVPGTPPFCRVCWMICTPLLMQASAAFRVLSRKRSPPAILMSRLVDVIAATPMTVRMMVSIRTVSIAMPSSRPSTALRAIRPCFSMVLRLSRRHDRRFLDLPLARLARGHAGIHACDVTSGLCHAASRRVGITIDPIENLDTPARGPAAAHAGLSRVNAALPHALAARHLDVQARGRNRREPDDGQNEGQHQDRQHRNAVFPLQQWARLCLSWSRHGLPPFAR